MKRGKICVAVAAKDAATVHAEVCNILEQVDVIEIRLDAMESPEVAKCCALLRKPLIFTNRPIWEGGAFAGFEDDRVDPLFSAIEVQAACVDFELRADPLLRKQLLTSMEQGSTRMILSWHDFAATPPDEELTEILGQMMKSGAHIGKLVTTARDCTDVLRMLRLQQRALEADFSLSCFCMGDVGRISRLATLYLGGYMSYGALSEDLSTAPGQLSADHLHTLCREFERNNGE